MSYLHVDENNILQPIGVRVLGDSRYEILPGTREYAEDIPGRQGEISFGVDLSARILELHCATEDGLTQEQLKAKMREVAGQLNPLLGLRKLTFADEPNKYYMVRYIGKMDTTPNHKWFDFILPFKMYDPFAYNEEDANEFVATSSGDSMEIEVGGTAETPPVITVVNEGTNIIEGFSLELIVPIPD